MPIDASLQGFCRLQCDRTARYYADHMSRDKEAEENANGEREPKYNGKELGDDPTKCPGEGFEWRGSGTPETGKGAWFNPTTEESLHPDFNHPPPGKPHWNYESPENSKRTRLNLDGTWENK